MPEDGNENLFHNLAPQLEGRYLGHKSGAADWAAERGALSALIPSLADQFRERYEITGVIGVGGVGVVLRVFDRNLEAPAAVKFPRPRANRQADFAAVIVSEIASLREAVHDSIIQIYSHGSFSPPESTMAIPYYVMELVRDAHDALEYFTDTPRSASEVVSFLKQVTQGLEHLHDLGILHGDMKLENMLVSPTGRAVIADLGSARRITRNQNGASHGEVDEVAPFMFTRPWAHPDLIVLAAGDTSSENRVRTQAMPRKKLRLAFDLYALGKNMFRLIEKFDPSEIARMTPYERKYLSLMAARLLDGRNRPGECALGLPPPYKGRNEWRGPLVEFKYTSAADALTDLRKLTGEYAPHHDIPELDPHPPDTVQASTLATTAMTQRLKALLSDPAVARLANVSQLGLLRYVYPTASHTRYEHMLGTFTNTARYIDALYYDPVNPLFRQIMTARDMTSALLASLLHDIGQYPMAHDLEGAQREGFSHTALTKQLLLGRSNNDANLPAAESLQGLIHNQWGVSSREVADVIEADPLNLEQPTKRRILHSLIDGPLDADKIDYLVRDSHAAGLPFGDAIEFDRLLSTLTVVYRGTQEISAALGIHEGGRIPAETVAFARYAMFGAVYWHHTHRAAVAMLQRAVWEGLADMASQRRSSSSIQRSLWSFLVNSESGQLEWRLTPSLTSRPTLLSNSDVAMLEWIRSWSSKDGQDLIDHILARRIYVRAAVISRKNQSLLERLVEQRPNSPTKMIKFQRDVEESIISRVEAVDRESRPPTSDLHPDAVASLLTLREKGVVILVDIPSDRPAATTGLEYLPETRLKDFVDEWEHPVKLEDSLIWSELQRSLPNAVGKVRILCHPAARRTILAAVPEDAFEDILSTAIARSAASRQ